MTHTAAKTTATPSRLGLLLAAGLAAATLAQAPTAPPTPPAPPAEPAAAAEPSIAPATPLPNLDDLLGTKPDTPATDPAATPPQPQPGDAATAPGTATELDRLLTGDEIGEAFTEAVTLMGDAAQRVAARKDVGIETQRVQEDIIRKLDQLLASLDNQQGQGGSSQSQSKSQSQGQQSQPSQRRGQQQGQPASGENQGDTEGPARQEGGLRPPIESARAAWGALPQRVRDMLMQGSADRFSSRYQRQTEEYYKRLAEEAR